MYICSYPVSFYSATTMRFVQVACNSGCDVLRILPCPPDVFLSSCYHRCFFSCCFRSLPLPSLSGQPIRRFEFHVLSLLSCFDCVDAARVVRLPWEFNSIYHRTSSLEHCDSCRCIMRTLPDCYLYSPATLSQPLDPDIRRHHSLLLARLAQLVAWKALQQTESPA